MWTQPRLFVLVGVLHCQNTPRGSLPIYGYFFRNTSVENKNVQDQNTLRGLWIRCASTDSVYGDKGGFGGDKDISTTISIKVDKCAFSGLTVLKALSVTFITIKGFVDGQNEQKISMDGFWFTDDSASVLLSM